MKNKLFFLFFFCLSFYFALSQTTHVSLPRSKEPVKIFSNQIGDNLRICICSAIKKAKHSIWIATYGLSDPYLIDILNAKAKNNVSIHVLLDPSNAFVKKNF